MAWISVHEQVVGGKLRTLAKELNCSQNEALGMLVTLWLWGINNADSEGKIIGATRADIAKVLYVGLNEEIDPLKAVDALITTGWIDLDTDLYLHEWGEWQEQWYKAMTAREKDKERKRRERAAKKLAPQQKAPPVKKEEPAISTSEPAIPQQPETHDELTGLYNMKRFYEKVNEITNKYPDDKFAIMIFNISRFKIVNDMFGRKMGDAILKQISENCLAQCSDKRVYARVESDNFITLCPKSDLVIKDLEKKRNIKVTYNNITCTVHIRYGIYEVDYDSKVDVGTMCDRARMALDSIKNNGNCVAAVYNDNLRNKILKEHMYKEELTSAIENEDFKVYLQPQVRCEDGLVKGAEALVRWEHRKLGLIPPGDFIEFFEQNGLITELDMYVWEKVCQILKQWKEEGRDDYIAVNISMKDFYIIDLYKVFTNLIEKYGIDKNKLRLEITESAFTLDLEKNVNVIKKLQMFGFIVEMDDFGSGYSSLNALKDIPVNIIKMDMRFVSQTQDPARADTIIKMILAMAKELNMEVVAEGVETVEQAEKLKQYGCSYIQGYLYAKPMPTEEYPEFVKNMKQGNFKR